MDQMKCTNRSSGWVLTLVIGGPFFFFSNKNVTGDNPGNRSVITSNALTPRRLSGYVQIVRVRTDRHCC